MSTSATDIVEVRFKGRRTAYFQSDNTQSLSLGDSVVVQLHRGQDLGRVSAVGETALKKCGGCDGCGPTETPETQGSVARKASESDVHIVNELRKAEDDVRIKVRERVGHHQLPMKVSDTEWQWDRKKLTIYFTAENRVDFRQLVRDLASLFRTRIELRQIGARDEAKRLSGVGRCGREYCCSSWLPELLPVSLSLAKDQRLSLNPSQISGGCGRLLCCLRYEHDFYVASRKRFPKEGKTVATPRGTERVQAVDIFRERILLRAEDHTLRSVSLMELRQEMSEMAAAPPKSDAAVPSSLSTFDEGHVTITEKQAENSVTPGRRGRRRRGRRGGRGGSDDDTPQSGRTGSPEPGAPGGE